MFSLYEVYEFLEAMDKERPVTIRLNTLKITKQQFIKSIGQKGIEMEIVESISDNCFKINKSPIPLGATTEYLAGFYMIQSAASMLPV